MILHFLQKSLREKTNVDVVSEEVVESDGEGEEGGVGEGRESVGWRQGP